MTGQGRGGGRPGGGRSGSGRPDSWRGPRDDPARRPSPPAINRESFGGPEVEELSVQTVVGRRSSKLGLSGLVAAGAVVALLAVGFGAFGGKAQPTPVPTAAAALATEAPTDTPTPPEPLVTPWTGCAAPSGGVPVVVLELHGQQIGARTELLTAEGEPGVVIGDPARERISIPIDVAREIWINGAACALAWTIQLAPEGAPAPSDEDVVIDSQPNAYLDSGVAAQNRFWLNLGQFEGSSFELYATLTFETLTVRASWPIHIERFDWPLASLRWGKVDVPLLDACDLFVTASPEWSDVIHRCEGSLSRELDPAVRVRAGAQPSFRLTDWTVASGYLTCGSTDGVSFFEDSDNPCGFDGEFVDGQIRFSAAPPGRHAIQISACGSKFTEYMSTVCGTWYANVDVRP